MQQISKPHMLHQITQFIYSKILEHTDFIGASLGTIYGIKMVFNWNELLLKMFVTGFLAVFGAIMGWATKVFIIHPLHRYLKIKFPKSKFFND